MFEAFDAIFNIIQTIVSFVTGFVEHIVFICTQIAQGFAVAGIATLHLPDIVKFFASAMLAYSIIVNLIHLGD